MSPSDFAWWQWFLAAVGAGIVSVVSGLIGDKAKTKVGTFVGGLIMVVTALAGFCAFVIAVVRLIRWAWRG